MSAAIRLVFAYVPYCFKDSRPFLLTLSLSSCRDCILASYSIFSMVERRIPIATTMKHFGTGFNFHYDNDGPCRLQKLRYDSMLVKVDTI